MNKITNTTKEEFNPSWLFGGNPGAIEDQESIGQQELVNSCKLPIICNNWPALEALGVEITERGLDNDLFHDVKIPNGWTKKATDHSMWSELLNEKNKVVANIFYKAAFYDRSSHMTVV
jgi:hypothetical protein